MSLFLIQFVTHTILDIIIDDEVEFLFRETIMLGENLIDFVDDGFGEFWIVGIFVVTDRPQRYKIKSVSLQFGS